MPVNGMMTMKAMQFPSNLPKGRQILLLLLMKMMKNMANEEFIRESAELFESEVDKKSK
jgi:hypothetical protein